MVDVNQFSQFEETSEEQGVTLHKTMRDQQLKQFGNLISESKLGDLSKVFLRMNYTKVPKDRIGKRVACNTTSSCGNCNNCLNWQISRCLNSEKSR